MRLTVHDAASIRAETLLKSSYNGPNASSAMTAGWSRRGEGCLWRAVFGESPHDVSELREFARVPRGSSPGETLTLLSWSGTDPDWIIRSSALRFMSERAECIKRSEVATHTMYTAARRRGCRAEINML